MTGAQLSTNWRSSLVKDIPHDDIGKLKEAVVRQGKGGQRMVQVKCVMRTVNSVSGDYCRAIRTTDQGRCESDKREQYILC
jgi:hypothetical protein